MDGWISVKDRLPQKGAVLCANAKAKWIRFGMYYKEFGWYYSATNERNQYAQIKGDGLGTPTHWMPLPEAPKEEE